MAHFIELTDTYEKKILINKEWIVKIKPDDDGSSTIYVGVPCLRGQKDNVSSTYEIIHVREKFTMLKNELI